ATLERLCQVRLNYELLLTQKALYQFKSKLSFWKLSKKEININAIEKAAFELAGFIADKKNKELVPEEIRVIIWICLSNARQPSMMVKNFRTRIKPKFK
ncbi:MAG: hypothetical protein ABI891_11800, partial [Acidobacteriota bacterium]